MVIHSEFHRAVYVTRCGPRGTRPSPWSLTDLNLKDISCRDTEAPWHAVIPPPSVSHAHSVYPSLPPLSGIVWAEHLSLSEKHHSMEKRESANKQMNLKVKRHLVPVSISSPGVSSQLEVVCFQITPPGPLFLSFPESILYLPHFDSSLTPSSSSSSLPHPPRSLSGARWGTSQCIRAEQSLCIVLWTEAELAEQPLLRWPLSIKVNALPLVVTQRRSGGRIVWK